MPAAARQSDTRSGTASPPRHAGEDLRQLVVEVRGRLEHALHDLLGLGPAAVAGEAERDQGVVVGPDGAVVVRERVVAGVPEDIVRTPQPDHSSSPISRSTTASRALRRDDAAPQQVAHVRAHRVDGLLVAVERKRVVAAALVDPVRVVERSAAAPSPLCRAGRRAPGRARPRARSRPCAASRRRRSPAPRTARSAAPPACRRAKRCESCESFHDWLSSPRARALLVLDEAVAVAVAVAVDPLERRAWRARAASSRARVSSVHRQTSESRTR